MSVGLWRSLISAAMGGLTETVAIAATTGAARWERKNFRGNTVNLAGGIGVAAGSLVGAMSAPDGLAVPSTFVTAVAASAGAADDFALDPSAAKGLKGHVRALARGEVTTGAVKLLGISAAAVITGAAISGTRGNRGGARTQWSAARVTDALASGALIAGSANLINLFDLRPGRAVKVGALMSGVLACSTKCASTRALAQSAFGTAVAAAPRDLRETTMLGDIGANSLGAIIGVAYAADSRPAVRYGALAGVLTLILASERVSFSAVIKENRALAWCDRLGRQP